MEAFTLELLLVSVSFAAWAAGHVGGPDGNPLQREAGSATALRTTKGTLQLGQRERCMSGPHGKWYVSENVIILVIEYSLFA